MFAVILLCGFATTMFTACGGDDEIVKPKDSEEEQKPDQQTKKAEYYDVTFTVVGQKSLLKVITADLTINYLKNGQQNKTVVELDEEFEGESALDALETSWFNKATEVAFTSEPKLAQEMNQKYIYRTTIKDIAVDTKYSYEFFCHANKNFQIAEGDSLIYMVPTMMITETAKGTSNREVVEKFYYKGGVVRPSGLARFTEQYDERVPMFLKGEYTAGERQ